jgi:hypothetical protein
MEHTLRPQVFEHHPGTIPASKRRYSQPPQNPRVPLAQGKDLKYSACLQPAPNYPGSQDMDKYIQLWVHVVQRAKADDA